MMDSAGPTTSGGVAQRTSPRAATPRRRVLLLLLLLPALYDLAPIVSPATMPIVVATLLLVFH